MRYIKRGVPILVISLLLVSVALAAHSATVTTDYVSIYETTGQNVSFVVSNGLFSGSSIEQVLFLLNNVNILSAVDVGWDSNVNGSSALLSTESDRISRWGSQNFGFEINTGNVDSNQTVDWVITTTDVEGDSEDTIITIMILNDDSAPLISDVVPADGSFIQEGTTDQEFSLTAIDPETGILSVSGVYGECSNLTNVLTFENSVDSYFTQDDLSSYLDSTVLCYEYTATSNGGEAAVASGQVTIDGVAPEVTLVFPDNGVLMNNNSLFQFTATDNLAPSLACVVNVDGVEADNLTILDGETADVSVDNIPEGEHDWSVTCTDLAGNVGTSETRTFILDKTAPVINVTSPLSGSVNKAGIPVEVEVTDNYGVTEIWYEFQNVTYTNITSPFSIDTSSAVDGPNLISIHALDEAGNEAVLDYIMVIDKEGPTIDLISPVDNGTFDYHVPFLLTVTDNYDPLLDCEVISGGVVVGSFQAENGNVTSETVLLELGTREIIVQCKDDAENMGNTTAITIEVVDLTGPDITLEDVQTVVRSELITFTATITDLSGVDTVVAQLTLADGTVVNITLNANGDVYTGEYQTDVSSPLGTYTLSVTANDTNGYDSTAMEDFEVINGYIITLDVTTPVTEGDAVSVSGTAQRDDNGVVDEVILVLPGEDRTIAVDNGSYATSFSSPSPGTYDIVAYFIVDNRTFSATAQLVVEAQNNGGGGGGGSGGGGGGHSTVVMHVPDPTPEPEPQPEEVLEPKKVEPEPVVEEVLEEKEVEPIGVGKASGFLNLENIKWGSILWILLAIGAVAVAIKMLAGKRKGRKGRRNDFDLDNYLSNRRR